MTKYIVSAAIIFLIIYLAMNVSSKKEPEIDNDEFFKNTVKKLEDSAIASPTNVDSTFLGYRFGMTMDESIKHTNELESKGILNRNEEGDNFFEIPNPPSNSFKGFLLKSYYKDSLYSIGLYFKNEDPINVGFVLSRLYINKYGECDFRGTPLKGSNYFEYYWFQKNQKISIKSYVTAVVEYTDVKIERQKLFEDSVIQNNKIKEVKKNI